MFCLLLWGDWSGQTDDIYPALQTSLQTVTPHLEHCLLAPGWISFRQFTHCPPPPPPPPAEDTAQGPLTAAWAERTVSPAMMSLVATRPLPAPEISATMKGLSSCSHMMRPTDCHPVTSHGQDLASGQTEETTQLNCQLLFPFFQNFLFLSF